VSDLSLHMRHIIVYAQSPW